MNRFEQPPHEPTSSIDARENERTPRLEIWITRHANRTPEGQLTDEGIAATTAKGRSLARSAEVVKGRSSREKTDRAYKTIDMIAQESGTQSPLTEERYGTRRREGLYYDVVGPLEDRIAAQSAAIDSAILRDRPDYDPKDPKWSKIREQYQYIGLHRALLDKELMHPMAMGMASAINQSEKIGTEYIRRRTQAVAEHQDQARPITKDVVLPVGTHGAFPEALLQKALIRETTDGVQRGFAVTEDEQGVVHLEDAMGSTIAPTESIHLGHDISEPTPERIPMQFEKERFVGEQTFLDMPTVAKLAEQYQTYQDMLRRWRAGELSKDDFTSELQTLVKEYETWEQTEDTLAT
ncbi:MAG: hypothetical protein HZC01_01380 [Candidatus Kerfeldbacteria bacterium]|nr:hypothetical protein [Candidatus Kerfeldbacteria bacterium]